MTLVLVGAGGLGRKIAAVAKPVAFVDQNYGGRVLDIPVIPLASALRSWPDATYCVTIWGAGSQHRIADTERDLRQRGVRAIVSFASLLRKHNLSHYYIGSREDVDDAVLAINTARALWADNASRQEFNAQVTARHTGHVSLCGEPVAGPQYFPTDLFRYRADEVVLDGGAYNGDTLRSFLVARHEFARWLAFEPHPENSAKFARYSFELPAVITRRVMLRQSALGASAGMVTLSREGGVNATLSSAPDALRVPMFAADALEPPNIPTFVKLDIEGAELAAIDGMRSLIQEVRPVMAVCVYHRPDHLWQVPLAIHRLMPDARFYLRPYSGEGWETVVYAIPPERAL